MRESGLLLPIFSLPGKYGIGCFSDEAYRFVDFLKKAGQSYWQILPVGPTGYGDSPYQSFSAFAGNPYFIDPDTLVREGLLTKEEAEAALVSRGGGSGPLSTDHGDHIDGDLFDEDRIGGDRIGADRTDGNRAECDHTDGDHIDYGRLYQTRPALLRRAFARWENAGGDPDYGDFLQENSSWLPDYALFMAVKEAHGGAGLSDWEEPLRRRVPAALEKARKDLRETISFHCFLQYQFEKQWKRLKAYANANGISIIGDIPIYVPADSVEIWSRPGLFQLNEDGTCRAVAGCPPDGFSAIGQLWGNPLYDWEAHRKTGYAWWTLRMRRCSALFDIIRIDHFRGFDQYYSIPADSKDARIGHWEDGPGLELFRTMEKELPGLRIIAEDLGYITESVKKLVRDTGYPNMKVLEFAFDSRDSSGKEAYLPYHFEKNCVVYTGTHDNETLVGWLDHILPEEREDVRAFTGLDGSAWALNADGTGDPQRPQKIHAQSLTADGSGSPQRNRETRALARALVRAAIASVADLCVIPMQDWLLLGNDARINTPSTTGKNWTWRMPPAAASDELADRIRNLTGIYGRIQA